MNRNKTKSRLFDPRHGEQPICLSEFSFKAGEYEPARTNYFNIYLIRTGSGLFRADSTRFAFEPGSLLFFVPYQYISLTADLPVQAEVIQFHANFLCVETFHSEVGCSGVLFNDPHGIPCVQLDEKIRNEIVSLIKSLRGEQQQQELAYSEVMLAHLKVLLILATRFKSSTTLSQGTALYDPRHPVLLEFRELIETHYCRLHAPAEYAKLLHMTPKTLGRIVRENLGTTPTELIRSRILTHAKWQLLHTLRPVKDIAREVGFTDELYFSRLFKKATGYSPTFFREFETEIRNGSNLSMFSAEASIPAIETIPDTGLQ